MGRGKQEKALATAKMADFKQNPGGQGQHSPFLLLSAADLKEKGTGRLGQAHRHALAEGRRDLAISSGMGCSAPTSAKHDQPRARNEMMGCLVLYWPSVSSASPPKKVVWSPVVWRLRRGLEPGVQIQTTNPNQQLGVS